MFDWILDRTRLKSFFGLIFCNTQTTVERQCFSAMKKRITSDSVQTWVPKIVKKPRPCSQAFICLPCKTWEWILRHRPVYRNDCRVVWILHTTQCSRRAACHKEQYREFALLNHRRISNLGFQTLRAEN